MIDRMIRAATLTNRGRTALRLLTLSRKIRIRKSP
jgi:hypothetical protein